MLTKTPKVGDEVFVTERGFRNTTNLLGIKTVSKVGGTYLHIEIYCRFEKFTFTGQCSTTNYYELWDSEESYHSIITKRRERAEKIEKIRNITSDWHFAKNLRSEALDEILQLLTPQVH